MRALTLLAAALAAQSTAPVQDDGLGRLDHRWRPSAEDSARYDYLHARYLRSFEKGFRKEESRRASACAKRLGPGSYEALASFHERCESGKGCNRLALADFYKLTDRLCRGREPGEGELEELRKALLHAVGSFKPGPHAAELRAVAEPFARKLFPGQESARYDEALAPLLR